MIRNIIEITAGIALFLALLLFLLVVWNFISNKRKIKKLKFSKEEQQKEMDKLLAKNLISKEFYDKFFSNREYHEQYDRGEITVEELEELTGEDWGYLKQRN